MWVVTMSRTCAVQKPTRITAFLPTDPSFSTRVSSRRRSMARLYSSGIRKATARMGGFLAPVSADSDYMAGWTGRPEPGFSAPEPGHDGAASREREQNPAVRQARTGQVLTGDR